MSSYIGRHAELYDIFYKEKDYSSEAATVNSLITRYIKKPVRLLELACGTGSFALELDQFGYQIDAFDYSEDMVSRAAHKSALQKSQVNFFQDDMRHFSSPKNHYCAAVCLFDSIGYVNSNESIAMVLSNVHNTLRPGGIFIFEFWHAAAMMQHYDPLRIKRWKLKDRELLRISETTLITDEQLAEVKYSVYELMNDGTYSTFAEIQKNRYFLKQEMDYLLKHHHFRPLSWFSNFDISNTKIDHDTWHILAVAQKSETL